PGQGRSERDHALIMSRRGPARALNSGRAEGLRQCSLTSADGKSGNFTAIPVSIAVEFTFTLISDQMRGSPIAHGLPRARSTRIIMLQSWLSPEMAGGPHERRHAPAQVSRSGFEHRGADSKRPLGREDSERALGGAAAQGLRGDGVAGATSAPRQGIDPDDRALRELPDAAAGGGSLGTRAAADAGAVASGHARSHAGRFRGA